jgi:hypothetical protein
MSQPIHVLNQMGVLTSFSVAKRVTEDDIRKYFSKQQRRGKSDHQIGEMLKNKIIGDINNAIQNNEVPGIVSAQDLARTMGIDNTIIKNIPELTRLVMVISNKLFQRGYDKMSLCYFINNLVNTLELGEDDFTEFNKKTDPEKDDEDGDEEGRQVFHGNLQGRVGASHRDAGRILTDSG